MDALRGERILAWLEDQGWVGSRDLLPFEAAPLSALTRAHTPAYLRSLEDPAEVARILGHPVTAPEARRALEMQQLAAGGTAAAVRHVLRHGGVALHLGGGFHHASPERGTGFCLLNDVVVAIFEARARGFRDPILVVDLDLHDGNGTRAAFAADPSVYTYSLHNQTWDSAPAVADTSVEFGPGVTDASLLTLLADTLPKVFRAHQPKLTIYVAGVDPLQGDAYGDGRMTLNGLLARDQFVLEQVRRAGTPLVHVLAGGYGGSAWRPTARLAAWILTGTVVDPPDDLAVALHRASRPATSPPAARATRAAPRSTPAAPRATPAAPQDPFDWTFSAEDVEDFGIASTPSPQSLIGPEHTSRIQAGLERFGILSQVRNRGYADPQVEVSSGSALGPVVRIWGAPDRMHLLMEVRFGRDQRTIPGTPLLRVEWLLLQDPRARFTPQRPPLPGQAYPGLGILADVVGWLVTLCEEEGLRGIVFRTAHFHVVALAERRLHFLTAEDRDRYQALRRRVEGGSGVRAGTRARVIEAEGSWPDTDALIPLGGAELGPTYPAWEPTVRPERRALSAPTSDGEIGQMNESTPQPARPGDLAE
jgi:acetoin utilization deacetylase AcuC-like enzyme